MSDSRDQRAALHELAVARAADKAARHLRVIQLHAQKLPNTVIARRLRMGDTSVAKVLTAAGLVPWRPCDVDCM